MLHVSHEAPVLGMIFAFFLILEPVCCWDWRPGRLGLWAGTRRALLPLMVRYTYGLVPMGFGMWLAHYGFHFLTGLYTVIPVTQSALASLGWPVLGEPRWTLAGLPANIVLVIEIGFLSAGLCRLVDGELWPGRKRFAAQADARVYPMGDGRPDSLGRIDVADVPAHGNARHHDERIR